MGNRAHVIFVDENTISPAVYLHWNGGPESVYGFLDELDRRKVRPDGEYDCARFIQLIGEFFDQVTIGGHSLGVTNGPQEITLEALAPYDHGDNGIYVVSRGGGEGLYDPGKRVVRRFLAGWDDEKGESLPLREQTPEEVELERKAASEDADAFATVFRKIQGDRTIES